MIVRSLLAAASGERALHVSPTSKQATDAFNLVREWRDRGLLTDRLTFYMNERRVTFDSSKGSVRFGDCEGTYQGLSLDKVIHDDAKATP